MARPPAASPARPRAAARSFPKSSFPPTPLTDDNSPATMPYDPTPTPPYSSSEDFGSYPQHHFMPPPGASRPTHLSVSPQQVMSSSEGQYAVHAQPYGASYFARPYYPQHEGNEEHLIPRQPPTPQPPFTPGTENAALPLSSPSEAGPSKSADKIHTPRPPNAWILYRSDMLRTIASGGEIPGLDSVIAELGVSGSSESSAEEAKADDLQDATSKRKTKKGKKGAKEPSEGLLSLGRGKTGRGLPQADISKMISMLWKRERPEVRGEYERRSEMKKQEHALMYPDYKFQPLRKADKIKQREEKEREKEAARREKEIQKSGNGRRRPRTRNRHSPTAPYSLLTPEGGRVSRSLTYNALGSSHDGQNSCQSNSVNNTPVETYDRFRSYPFPIPQSSLPSMKAEELGVPYDATFVASSQQGSHSVQPTQHESSEALHTGAPAVPETMPLQYPFTAPSSRPDSGVNSPRQSGQTGSIQHEMPESIPVPSIKQASAGQPNPTEPHDIAALWSGLGDEGQEMYQPVYAQASRRQISGSEFQAVRELIDEEGRTLPFAQPTYQTFAEVELRNIQAESFDNSWLQYETPYGATDGYAYVPYSEDLQTGLPIMYMGDSSMPGEEIAWNDAIFDFTNASDSPIVIGDPSGPLVPMEAVIVEDHGPFLYEQTVFSPDAEALRPSDSNTPGRPSNTEENEQH